MIFKGPPAFLNLKFMVSDFVLTAESLFIGLPVLRKLGVLPKDFLKNSEIFAIALVLPEFLRRLAGKDWLWKPRYNFSTSQNGSQSKKRWR